MVVWRKTSIILNYLLSYWVIFDGFSISSIVVKYLLMFMLLFFSVFIINKLLHAHAVHPPVFKGLLLCLSISLELDVLETASEIGKYGCSACKHVTNR